MCYNIISGEYLETFIRLVIQILKQYSITQLQIVPKLVATFRSPTASFIRLVVRHVTKRRSYAVGKLYAPPSPFMQLGSFRIQIDSLTCLVFRCPLSKILAPDQFMTWFSFATWSVMANFFISAALLFRSDRVNVLLLIDSTSFLCSSYLFP